MNQDENQKIAYLFPGQGTQWVGMGRSLYQNYASAKMTFDEADDVLDFPLSRLCFEGPEDTLRQTINAQPAILTYCVASLRSLPPYGVGNEIPSFVAGHSLGEYTSLVAAGTLDFADTLRLVRERGRLMQEASERTPGTMIAVLGLDIAAVEEVCQDAGVEMANINCPGQIILSGTVEALKRAAELAKAKGTSKVIPLEVSGAFHSRLMQPAQDEMAQFIHSLHFRQPAVPVVANTTAEPLTTTKEIKAELISQLCSCVRWLQSVEYLLKSGVVTFVEIGPGRVLSGLIKRIDKKAKTMNVGEEPSS